MEYLLVTEMSLLPWDSCWPLSSSPFECGSCLRHLVPVPTSLENAGSPEVIPNLWLVLCQIFGWTKSVCHSDP